MSGPEPRAGVRPLIVIGSGRSGTALATRILEDLGYFMGARQDVNHEALFFIRLNTWLMARAGVSWHSPEALRDRLRDPAFVLEAIDHFRERSGSAAIAAYLGHRRYRRHRSLEAFSRVVPWGWKDPRNTFTLAVWREVFPEARVIHVRRHGIDVAASYWRIQQERSPSTLRFLAAAAAKRRYHLPTILREIKTWRNGTGGDVRLRRFERIDDALGLWDLFTAEAAAQVDDLGAHACVLGFEELVADPAGRIARLADFCELEVTPSRIERAAEGIDPARRFAYLGSPELRAVAERHSELLAGHGYGPGGPAVRHPSLHDGGRAA